MTQHIVLVQFSILGSDREYAATRHRVACVRSQIQQYLFHLASVCSQRVNSGLQVCNNADVLANQALEHLSDIADDRIYV
jgi:hypothetical protein